MAKIISIFNQKGGAGKTTSALNIATALAEKGSTLLIDNDGQANASLIALTEDIDVFEENNHGTIFELFTNKDVKVEDVIYPTSFKNVDIIPATIDHVYTDMKLMSMVDNSRILLKKIQSILGNYEYIVIDNPPAICLTTYNTLMISDVVVAPIESSVFSAKGLKNLIDLIDDINDSRDTKLQLLTFMSKVDNRKKVKNIQTKNVLEKVLGTAFIKEHYISLNTACVDSLEDCETTITWHKDNASKTEYINLTNAILNRMEAF